MTLDHNCEDNGGSEMWELLTGLVTGGAGLIGNMFSSEQSARNTEANIAAQQAAQQQTMEFNAAQASANRQFQQDQGIVTRGFVEQMANTAHRREVDDLRLAGLNPILSAGGSGAASPGVSPASGSSASVSTPNMALHNTQSAFAGLGDVVGKAVSSAVQAKTFDKMTEEIANIQADTAKTKAAERLVEQQKETETHETRRRQSEATKSGMQILREQLSNEEANAILNMPKWLRDTLVQTGYSGNKVSDTIAPLTNSARTVERFLPRRSTVETSEQSGPGFRDTFQQRFEGIRTR